jgi:hypothetical protein
VPCQPTLRGNFRNVLIGLRSIVSILNNGSEDPSRDNPGVDPETCFIRLTYSECYCSPSSFIVRVVLEFHTVPAVRY